MFPPLLLSIALLALPPEVNPSLFPGVGDKPAAEIELAGLASLYPGRILHEAPHALDPRDKGREPMQRELPRDLDYLRIYDLGAALPQITKLLADKPALILDLRFVYADAKDSADFAGVLSTAGLDSDAVQAMGDDMPSPAKLPLPDAGDSKKIPLVIALVNGQTSGPLEAWLAAFQDKEGMLLVGTPTAGQPANYKTMANQPGYSIIDGELVPSTGSLVGIGVQPRFAVEVTPQESYTEYQFLESRDDITTLLRHDATPAPVPAKPATTSAAAPIPQSVPTQEISDPVLQRAVDVVAALQVLGRLPASSGVPAASAPATTAQR